jgi:hypothetical protein
VEVLESRVALTADVAVAVVDGDLTIQGGPEDNGVFIRQIALAEQTTPWPGARYEIFGSKTGGGRTVNYNTINGQSSVIVEGVINGVQIDLGDGDDVLAASRPQPNGGRPNANLPGLVTIDMGAGRDTAHLFIENHRRVEVDLGTGRDIISMRGCRLNVLNLVTEPASTSNLPGSELVFLSNMLAGGDVSVRGGGGSQEFRLSGVNTWYRGYLFISGGDGADLIELRQGVDTFAQNARLSGGSGDDVLRIEGNGRRSTGFINITGDAGDDLIEIFTLTNSLPPLSLRGVAVSGGSGIDTLRVDAPLSMNHIRVVNIDMLENRAAVDVTAAVVDGVLTIQGGPESNGVFIRQLPPALQMTTWPGARYEISGRRTARGITTVYNTISGQPSVVVEGVINGVEIDLGDGSDFLVASRPSPNGGRPNANLPGLVTINMGAGRDRLYLYIENHRRVDINLGTETDVLHMAGARLNSLNLVTEPAGPPSTKDPEFITLQNIVADGPVSLVGGGGTQKFAIKSVNPYRSDYRDEILVAGRNGDDQVIVSGLLDGFGRRLRLNGGGGDDCLFLFANGQISAELVVIDGGPGDDSIRISPSPQSSLSVDGEIRVFAGTGDDTFNMGGGFSSVIARQFNVQMGAGNDRTGLFFATIVGFFSADMGDGADELSITNLTIPSLNAASGDGDDTVLINKNTFLDVAVFDGGAGVADEWRVSTGVEPDEWSILGLTRINFETVFDNQQTTS